MVPSKLYSKCESCANKDNCDNKKMGACAYIPRIPLLKKGGNIATSDATAPHLIPHDYRDITISEGTTITIDLEDIKKELARSVCPINLQHGA